MMVVTATIGLARIGLTQQRGRVRRVGRAPPARDPTLGPKRQEIGGRQHLASWPERHSGSPPMILCAHDTWVATSAGSLIA